MINRADVQQEERLFLIAPWGYVEPSSALVQPANVGRRIGRQRAVDTPTEGHDDGGWSLPPLFEPHEHAAALVAHASRIRSGSITSTVLLEDL